MIDAAGGEGGSGLYLAVWFAHLLLTAVIGWAMWRHLRRSRQPIVPPRHWMAIALVGLVAISLAVPADLLDRADPGRLVPDMTLDPFMLFLLPPLRSDAAIWVMVAMMAGGIASAVVPWLLRDRPPTVVEIDEAACTGCDLCVVDCPYLALRLEDDDDGRPVARLDADACVACGICLGSCSFGAIRMDGHPSPEAIDADGRDIVLTCRRQGRHRPVDDADVSVIVECTGALHPGIAGELRRHGATSVEIAGCGPGECAYGIGNQLTHERLDGTRRPHAARRDQGAAIETYVELGGTRTELPGSAPDPDASELPGTLRARRAPPLRRSAHSRRRGRAGSGGRSVQDALGRAGALRPGRGGELGRRPALEPEARQRRRRAAAGEDPAGGMAASGEAGAGAGAFGARHRDHRHAPGADAHAPQDGSIGFGEPPGMSEARVISMKSGVQRPLARQEILGVLDVGSTKMCCLIGRNRPGAETELLGASYQLAEGLKAGEIVDVEAVEASILAVVHEAEQQAGETLRDVVVGVTAGRPSSRRTVVEQDLGGRAVTVNDLLRALSEAEDRIREDGIESLHALPVEVTLDGGQPLKDPRGMIGRKLAVEAHIVQTAAVPLHNLVAAVERCHLEVRGVVANAYAAGLAALSEEEMALGALVLDLGGGAKVPARFAGGKLQEILSVPLDSCYPGSSVRSVDRRDQRAGERLKTLYGSALEHAGDSHERIEVPGTRRRRPRRHKSSRGRD